MNPTFLICLIFVILFQNKILAEDQVAASNVTISQVVTAPTFISPSQLGAVVAVPSPAQQEPQVGALRPTPVPEAQAQNLQPAAEVSSIIGGEVLKIKDSKEFENSDEEANIYLNFDNASLVSVVNYLAEQKKINILPHKDLPNATVTLSTRTPMTLDRAWNVLLTLLEMNGFSVVKVGNLHRIVSNKENKFEPLPIYSSAAGVEPESLPDNETAVRFVYFFKNIKVEMVRDILGQMLDREGILISADLNACIIRDTCLKIKSAMKIMKELDQGGLSEQIRMIVLKHATAEVVAKLFEEILQVGATTGNISRFGDMSSKKERAFFSTSTRILSEPSKNALFLLGTQKNLDRITDFIYKYIDVPIGNADSRLHLKEIKYAKAEDLVNVLMDVIKPPRGQGSDKSVMVGEYKFFEDVAIVAEKAPSADQASTRGGGNRLIVACTKDDWKRLEKIINKLDKPQPQVAFEIMIISVDMDEQKQLGSQMYGFFGRQPGMGVHDVEFSNLSAAETKDSSGGATPVQHYIKLATSEFEGKGHPSFLTLGRAGTVDNPGSENIWSIIKTVFNIDNSHIVSQPYLVTNNNQPCCEEVTQTIRAYSGLTSGKGEPSKQQLVDFAAKTRIELTPRMNLDGVVDLDIQVDVSDFLSQDIETPSRSTKFLKTRTSLLSGEVLVLGGLTKKKNVDGEWKTPLLGDIPIIGGIFFKNKTKEVVEENLYIFIRPSILKPKFSGESDEYTQLKLDYAKYQLLKNDTYLKEKDPIQRWFFKPPDQSIKQKLLDGKRGVIRPLDNFVSSKYMPRMVNIKEDSYFKVSEELEKQWRLKEKKKLVAEPRIELPPLTLS